MGNLFSNKNQSESQSNIEIPTGLNIISSKIPDDLLGLHDYVRSTAGLGPLKENSRLKKLAGDWARHLVNEENCTIRHPLQTEQEKERYLPGSIGQNIYVGHGYPEDPSSPKNVISAWYDECLLYDSKAIKDGIPTNFKDVGHFTQVMWKDAKEIGCERVECPKKFDTENGPVDAKGAVVVCNYDKGNVSGQFPTQVIYSKCPINL